MLALSFLLKAAVFGIVVFATIPLANATTGIASIAVTVIGLILAFLVLRSAARDELRFYERRRRTRSWSLNN